MKPITPFLWFATQAEEAALFYVSVFKDGKMGAISRYGAGTPMPAGTVMTASFEIGGQSFTALNVGQPAAASSLVSFVVPCDTQEEIDWYWDKLGEGGEYQRCGWLKDKFGVAWQVIPARLPEIMGNTDPAKAQAAMQAMMQMKKLVVADLEKAGS